MNDAVITYTDEDTGVVFHWRGGAYIEVGYMKDRTHAITGQDLPNTFQAEDVINVWDDEKDQSRFETDADGRRRPFRVILEWFEETCQEYLKDAAEEEAGR